MEEMLKVADKNQFAVGAFNATESSLFRAVVEEAEAQNAPAIVQVAPGEFDFATRDFYQYVRARLSNSKSSLCSSSGSWKNHSTVYESDPGRFHISYA